MAGRAMAKPAATTPVVSAEEQAKDDEQVKAAETAQEEKAKPESKKSKHRSETFERTGPDGTVFVVKRNIDTGEQTVTKK